MDLKNKVKNNAKKKAKKIAFKVLKPFLPFILIIGLLFFAICSIIDAIFVQEVQTDMSSLPQAEQEIRTKCIEKAESLNTCHNYKDGALTNYLLDMNNRENDKLVEWSHLYAIMAFHNMTSNTKIDEKLLNKISKEFESTFKYEQITLTIETTTTDDKGNTTTSTSQETSYILVESDTIIGHYKYNYEEKTVENGNTKTTGKFFTNEELIGEKYERLRKYLKEKLHIKEDDLENDVQIVIQAANGYYSGEENTSWLRGNNTSDAIITNGEGLIPKGMFIWPIPGYTKITSHFGMRTHPITGVYKLHSGTDVGAPIGANFVAMADGTVINASYNSAYGNMVMIDHRKWNSNFVCTRIRNTGKN